MINFLINLICLMPHKLALYFGGFLGKIFWLLSWKKVDVCESRCVKALGTGITNARKIILDSYINISRSAIEFIRLEKLMPNIKNLVEFSPESIKVLRDAQARNKGVILMIAHLDNWEIAGARATLEGFNLTPIYTPQKNYIENFIMSKRTQTAGMNMIKDKGRDMRKIFKTLKENGIIIILQDLDARSDGVITNFFNMPASTHEGIIKLYKKFGSPIVPALFYRDEKDFTKHHIIINEVLSDKFKPDDDIKTCLNTCNKIIESWIKKFPDQWLWLLDKWEYAARKNLK